ncbi:MAG TPA: hypothetical protein VEJ84_18490, partial [Acidimicrobiales bacterium]|nr:hypothetical protein [Acidimicrobiales bacterium]
VAREYLYLPQFPVWRCLLLSLVQATGADRFWVARSFAVTARQVPRPQALMLAMTPRPSDPEAE